MFLPVTEKTRYRVLLVFWAFMLLVGAGALLSDNLAPQNPNGGSGYGNAAPYGWDIRVVCQASRAYEAGRDPYYVRNLEGTNLSYPYLPIYLSLLAPLCSHPHALDDNYQPVYQIALLLIIIILANAGSRLARMNALESLITTAVLVDGFSGFHWIFLTGNVALFMGLMLAGMVFCFRRSFDTKKLDAYAIGGTVLFGLALSLKPYFVPVGLGLFFLPKDIKTKIMLAVMAGAAFIVPVLLSYALYPDIFPTFMQAVQGLIPGQHSPATEGCNPSLYCLSQIMTAHYFGIGDMSILHAINIIVALIVIGLLAWRLMPLLGVTKKNISLKKLTAFLTDNPRFAMHLTWLTMFTIMLLMPRVKEYGYFDIAILAAPVMAVLPFAASLIAGAFCLPVLIFKIGLHSYFGGYDQVPVAMAIYFVMIFSLKPSFEKLRGRS